MSKQEVIRKDLIQLDWKAEDQAAFFDKMATKLEALGYVRESFREAVKKREAEYPTALPIEPYPIAIPHVDPEHVLKPFIACTRLKRTVKWHEMQNNAATHDVRFIFMLGIMGKHGEGEESLNQVEVLQLLVNNCQKEELMKRLADAQSEQEYYDCILSMDGLAG